MTFLGYVLKLTTKTTGRRQGILPNYGVFSGVSFSGNKGK